ncbi:unnamed protein product [Linum trigynum]|uniref:RNase H type-1 domain-containing protein n=1 Tax=Linum trigynum TaxID=586398 RepID=A0AAV2FTL1_9ROSI
MEVSRRIVTWAVELSEYDIQYVHRPAIKAQILTDFLAEVVFLDTAPEGKGVVVRTPVGAIHEIAICFRTLKTNNVAEYEAILAGLAIARDLGVKTIRVLSDSVLVVNQLYGVFEAKEDTLAQYIERVKQQANLFETVTYVQIPREENVHVDALSKITTATNFESTRLVSVQKEDQETQQLTMVNTTQIEEEDGW